MREYTIIVTEEEEGGYSVEVPALPGCFSRGETIAEAREHAREAIAGHISALEAEGLPVPVERRLEVERISVPAA